MKMADKHIKFCSKVLSHFIEIGKNHQGATFLRHTVYTRQLVANIPLSSLWYSSTIWYMKPFLSEKFWFLSAPSSVSIIGMSLTSIALITDVRPSAMGLSSFAPFCNVKLLLISYTVQHTQQQHIAATLYFD